MSLGMRTDPLLAFRFVVEIEGLLVGGFNEVTGLQVEVDVERYQEGGLNEYIHQLPGPARYPQNLVLKHGLTDSTTLWAWHQDVRNGKVTRKNGSIVLLDSAGQEQWRWNFVGAYPVRWSGPDLRAGSADVAFESVELAHHGLAKS